MNGLAGQATKELDERCDAIVARARAEGTAMGGEVNVRHDPSIIRGATGDKPKAEQPAKDQVTKTRACRECNENFDYVQKSGRPPEFCSKECKRKRTNRNDRERDARRRQERVPKPVADAIEQATEEIAAIAEDTLKDAPAADTGHELVLAKLEELQRDIEALADRIDGIFK